MILAEYRLDIMHNLITRAPIIILLIIILFLVLGIGIYVEVHKIKELLKINNELIKETIDNFKKRDTDNNV